MYEIQLSKLKKNTKIKISFSGIYAEGLHFCHERMKP